MIILFFDYIVESTFNIGSYNTDNNYSYLNTYSSQINANIGLYSLGQFYVNDYSNIYTITPYNNTKNTIYTINNGRVYADYTESEYQMRPVLSLDGNIFIISGKGTSSEPYEIGR